MAYRSKRGGTLIIDRQFAAVGRIAKASGTTDKRVFNQRNKMLTDLHDTGRPELLRSIRDGVVSIAEVHEAYRKNEIDLLAAGASVKPLATAFEVWSKTKDCSADYRRTLGTTMRYIREHDPNARVADTPRILERLSESLKIPSFNRTRAHILSFIRSSMKKHHPLYLACSSIDKKREKVARISKRPSPRELAVMFPSPHIEHVDALAWSIALTGMHQKELWGEWACDGTQIHVHGTKRDSRDRVIPCAFAPVSPSIARTTFDKKFRKRETGLVPYQLRGSYSHWLEASGIFRTRRRMYLGHSVADVTELYERHEVEKFLAGDAVLMRSFVFADMDGHENAGLRSWLESRYTQPDVP